MSDDCPLDECNHSCWSEEAERARCATLEAALAEALDALEMSVEYLDDPRCAPLRHRELLAKKEEGKRP